MNCEIIQTLPPDFPNNLVYLPHKGLTHNTARHDMITPYFNQYSIPDTVFRTGVFVSLVRSEKEGGKMKGGWKGEEGEEERGRGR